MGFTVFFHLHKEVVEERYSRFEVIQNKIELFRYTENIRQYLNINKITFVKYNLINR